MSNDQFKIDSNSSLFNLKETFNTFLDKLSIDGTMNLAPNSDFEMIHKDALGIDRLHGWNFFDSSLASNAGATAGNYTKLQSKITWNLDTADVATMDVSGRLQSNSLNEFAFLVKYKTNHPLVISIESSIGMLLNHEIGNGVGYLRTGENPLDILDLNSPEQTFPNIFIWSESDATTISNAKTLFLPQNLTEYSLILVPIKFLAADIENESITFNIKGLTDGTLFDVQKVIVKEGFFEKEFLANEDHFYEHVRYNLASGKWEISNDGSSWEEIKTSGSADTDHNHTKSQILDLDVNSDISAYLDEAILNGSQTGGITLTHNGSIPSLNISIVDDDSALMLKSVYDPNLDGIVTSASQMSDGVNIVTAAQGRTHIDDVTKHRIINDAGTSATELWSASKINSLTSTGSILIGSVLPWFSEVVPSGYLFANGAALNKVTYAALYSILGGRYGSDATTFNLPDLRGEFIRGWSDTSTLDPDKATRTNRGDGTTGNVVGTKQDSGNLSHRHQRPVASNTHNEMWGGGSAGDQYTFNSSQWTDYSGGAESRPVNIYAMYIIKY